MPWCRRVDQALRETLRQQRLERLELPRRCQFNTFGWLSFHLACGNLWKRNRMNRQNRLLMKLTVDGVGLFSGVVWLHNHRLKGLKLGKDQG